MARSLESSAMTSGASCRSDPPDALRVLHVIPAEPEGSMMIFAKRQVDSLQRPGILNRPFYLASRTSPSILRAEYRRFLQAIESFKPSIVNAHYGKMTAFFCITATKVPVVITFRGNDLNLHPIYSWKTVPGIFLSQLAALKARRIICVSGNLQQKLWWRRDNVVVIPSGVDTRMFFPRPKVPARESLGWGQEANVVLFNAARGAVVKRVELAQAAVRMAEKSVGKIRFAVMDGYLDATEVPVWMNASDCLLLTSKTEGSPNVVKEAMACNLPVVSVDVGDVKERLKGVQPSCIVGGSSREIGAALAGILKKPCRSNGYEKIQELSLEKTASRILSLYYEIATTY